MYHPVRQGLVLFVANVERVAAFYRETLGLHAVESAKSHILLSGPGVEIVIHSLPKEYCDPDAPVTVREDSYHKPTFYVDDLDAVSTAAEATGGYLKPRAKAWNIRGAIVLDGHDPEGNVVQFKEMVK